MIIKKLPIADETPGMDTLLFVVLFFLAYTILSSLSLIFFQKLSIIASLQDLMFWSIINTLLLNLLLTVFVLLRFRAHLTFVMQKPFRHFAVGLFFYIICIPFIIAITLLTNVFMEAAGFAPSVQKIVSFYLETDSVKMVYLIFFASSFVAPVAEEILYRGVVYRALRSRFSFLPSIFLSSAIFSLLHGEITALPALFFLGIVLAFLYEKHNNLWVPIGLHFFNNFFANVALFIIKYTDFINVEQLGF